MSQAKIGCSERQTQNKVIEIAKSWVGTPYQHQAMVKGAGADCVGLVVGVGLEAGVLSLTTIEKKAYSGYSRLPSPKRMLVSLKKHLLVCSDEDASLGDVVWIQWRQDLPMHLALLSEHKGARTLLHAISDAGKVVEHALTKQWEERIVSYWRFPGLN